MKVTIAIDLDHAHVVARAVVNDDGGQLRVPVPSAVTWSEPRFHDPGPHRPEFPSPWRGDAWAEHGGLRFIDAWDAYEWAQEQGQISGRFWEAASESTVGARTRT